MRLNFGFSGEIWQWRGPAPFYFVTVPTVESEEIRAVSSQVTYGWGMIPVKARIGETEWETAMFYKEWSYVVPIKKEVRVAENVGEGDVVEIELGIEVRSW